MSGNGEPQYVGNKNHPADETATDTQEDFGETHSDSLREPGLIHAICKEGRPTIDNVFEYVGVMREPMDDSSEKAFIFR